MTVCAMGALFRYLVWKFDIFGDRWPDFTGPGRRWYPTCKLYDVTDSAMDTAFRQVLAEYSHNVGKITHMRKLGAMHMSRLPYVLENSIQGLGFWKELDGGRSSKVMQNSYMGVNPTACMHATEHPRHDLVLLARQRVDPLESLCSMVFPNLARHKEAVTARLPNKITKDLPALRFREA